MTHEAQCKFCRRPLTVEIDETYASMGDPHKLLPLLCCDTCASIVQHRNELECAIGRAIHPLAYCHGSPTIELTSRVRKVLEKLTQKYTAMVCAATQAPGDIWEPAIVDAMIAQPKNWRGTLKQCWRAAK